jgi:hypothetical protein
MMLANQNKESQMTQSNVDQFIHSSALYFKLSGKNKILISPAESNELLFAEFNSFPNYNTFIVEAEKPTATISMPK